MTLHALLAHLEELSRLKVHILYQRPALANDSVASSTRSTDGLLSTMPIVTATSDLSVETFGGGKKNVVIKIFATARKN